jgi:hypothetical protein
MNATNRHPRLFASWHLPAIAFFASGLLAGVAFAVAAPVAAIRLLGGLAIVAGVLGIATVACAARLENPRIFGPWHASGDSLRAAMREWGRDWADRARHVDRYLQNAVWSAMG